MVIPGSQVRALVGAPRKRPCEGVVCVHTSCGRPSEMARCVHPASTSGAYSVVPLDQETPRRRGKANDSGWVDRIAWSRKHQLWATRRSGKDLDATEFSDHRSSDTPMSPNWSSALYRGLAWSTVGRSLAAPCKAGLGALMRNSSPQ